MSPRPGGSAPTAAPTEQLSPPSWGTGNVQRIFFKKTYKMIGVINKKVRWSVWGAAAGEGHCLCAPSWKRASSEIPYCSRGSCGEHREAPVRCRQRPEPWGHTGHSREPRSREPQPPPSLQLAGVGEQHPQPWACPGAVNCSREPLGGQASSGPVQLQTLAHSSTGICAARARCSGLAVQTTAPYGIWDLLPTQPGQDWQQQPLLPPRAISDT